MDPLKGVHHSVQSAYRTTTNSLGHSIPFIIIVLLIPWNGRSFEGGVEKRTEKLCFITCNALHIANSCRLSYSRLNSFVVEIIVFESLSEEKKTEAHTNRHRHKIMCNSYNRKRRFFFSLSKFLYVFILFPTERQ